MITNHTQLLNALIEKYNLLNYLEIGVQNPDNNFYEIIHYRGTGVDPSPVMPYNDPNIHRVTSDEFFKYNTDTFDLIFIDGLHHADQVKRDFENSLQCLSDNGFIVIHDVLPENEAGSRVPRETKQWWGDVYKFAMNMNHYPVGFRTFNIDNGCMLVWKEPGKVNYNGTVINPSYDEYIAYGKKIMNVEDGCNL